MERIVGWNGVRVAMINMSLINWIDYILYRNEFRYPLNHSCLRNDMCVLLECNGMTEILMLRESVGSLTE